MAAILLKQDFRQCYYKNKERGNWQKTYTEIQKKYCNCKSILFYIKRYLPAYLDKMHDNYTHIDTALIYTVESIPGPVEHSTEYEELLNNFNSQLIQHCLCDTVCTHASCICLQKYAGGQPTIILPNKVSLPIIECNDYCRCSQDCGNRSVQQGPIKGLIVDTCKNNHKGLGLYTENFIQKGKFICEYAGELITKSQARIRHQSNMINGKNNYIFCLNEHIGDKTVQTYVDPSLFGNIGRYINHSCEPNCLLVPVRWNTPIPKIAIFASKDILPKTEITFHYGEHNIGNFVASENVFDRKKCLCHSNSCKGFMPYDAY